MRTSSPADIPLSTVVKYGDYDFSAAPTNQPVPFVTVSQQMLNDHNGRWGRRDSISINGTITGDFDTITGAQIHIISGFSKDFQTFEIYDTGIWAEHEVDGSNNPESGALTDKSGVYSGNNCIVRGISFDEGRYHGMLNYSIDLEAYQDGYTPTSGVLDPVNQYSFSEDENEDTITITHNISARGIVSGSADPLTAAKNFVHGFTGYNGISPKFVTTGASFCPVLKTQSETIDRPSATYSIVETYEAEASGCSPCIVKYSCSLDSGIRDDFVRGSINGEVNCGKTGTLADARDHFQTLTGDLYDMLSADTSYSDFYEIPITFNSQEVSGSKKITFSATYDNNNILKSGSKDFVYSSSGAYYEYNVGINYDETTEVATASIQGSVQSRGNLQEKMANVNDFISTELCRSGSDHGGTGVIRDLTNAVYTGLTGSDFLGINGHPLNLYPNSLSIVSGKGNGSASISASYDNSDKIQTAEIRDSSYNINVKVPIPIYKPRASVNEDGAYGIYKTNVYGREEVNINGAFVADHRQGVMTKNSTIESSGVALVDSLKTAFLTGAETGKRIETESVNRAEANGGLNFTYAFSENTSGIIPPAMTFKSSEE